MSSVENSDTDSQQVYRLAIFAVFANTKHCRRDGSGRSDDVKTIRPRKQSRSDSHAAAKN